MHPLAKNALVEELGIVSMEIMGASEISDPMERILAEALEKAGINFQHECGGTIPLDFYLPDAGVHIEVKQMHSDRIAGQMARAQNVIAAQGRTAVEWLATLITDNFHLARELRETTAALLAERASGIISEGQDGEEDA